jgi:DNA-binding response OmpR family regulator
MTPPTVLLIEDDPTIGENLSRALDEQFDVRWCRSGLEGLGAAPDADLVILDLGLPDVDGLDLCRRLVDGWPSVPVVILTARQEEVQIIEGLEAGAVDYITKPFRLGELLARVRAHLRTTATEGRGPLRFGDVEIEAAARRVTVAGQEVPLRPKELDLLLALADHVGTVVTREVLMRDVWDEHWFGSTKTLDVHMANLRRKLAVPVATPCTITTLRGVGFRLETS